MHRVEHEKLLKLIVIQGRDLTLTHRRLRSRGGGALSLTTTGLETRPAIKDLVLESRLAHTDKAIPCALTGPLRLKKPRIRPSESIPRRSSPSQTRSTYHHSITVRTGESVTRPKLKKSRLEDLLRKEKLYARLEALATPCRTNVFDSISLTSGRLQSTNATLR